MAGRGPNPFLRSAPQDFLYLIGKSLDMRALHRRRRGVNRWVIVRNAFGFQLYIGNPALAQTFVAGLPIEGTDTPWTAAAHMQALATLRDLEHHGAFAASRVIIIEALCAIAL